MPFVPQFGECTDPRGSVNDIYHTIYKNHFVLCNWDVCGCMWVCDTSSEPPRPPYERMMEARPLARAARPQRAKMRSAHYISHFKMTV